MGLNILNRRGQVVMDNCQSDMKWEGQSFSYDLYMDLKIYYSIYVT